MLFNNSWRWEDEKNLDSQLILSHLLWHDESFQDTNLRDFCDPRPVALRITFWNQEEFEDDKDLMNDGAEAGTGLYNRGRMGHFSPGWTNMASLSTATPGRLLLSTFSHISSYPLPHPTPNQEE